MTSLDPNCLKKIHFHYFFRTNPIKNEYFKPINGAIILIGTQTYQKKNEQVVPSNNVTVTCFNCIDLTKGRIEIRTWFVKWEKKCVCVCVLWHRFFCISYYLYRPCFHCHMTIDQFTDSVRIITSKCRWKYVCRK